MTAAEFRRTTFVEKHLVKAVEDLLAACRIPYSVTDSALVIDKDSKVRGRAVRTDGWPDVTCCLPGGRFFGIETKTSMGRLRPSQIRCHAELRAAGGIVIIPRSIEDVAQALRDAGIAHSAIDQILKQEKPRSSRGT